MSPILFTVGNFEIRWYAVILLTAIVLGYIIMVLEAKRLNIRVDYLENLVFWTVIAAFIGARLYYAAFNYEYYSVNPVEIIQIWKGGLAIHGALIAGIITILLYTKKYNMNTLRTLDVFAVSTIIGQAIGRWGNFFNSEAHGAATTLGTLVKLRTPEFIIKGMHIDGVYYFPTFFYESIWCFIGFIILLFLRKYKYLKIGQLTSFYLMWYGFGRFFIEISRTDSLMFYGFKIAQIVSILMFLIGLITFIIFSRKGKFEDLYNETLQGEIKY